MGYENYYADTVEQFSFFQYPYEILLNDEFADLSAEAKTLYCVMRNRLQLSRANKWLDDTGRVYIIFTITEIMKVFKCSRDKAVRTVKELEKIGLIEKSKVTKLGTPSLIYVNNFMARKKVTTKGFETSPKIRLDQSENQTRDQSENQTRPVRKSDSSYINNNYINNSYINEGYSADKSAQTTPVKNSYGKHNNVLLTDKQYNELKTRYTDYEEKINNMSEYLEGSGKKYKNHFVMINRWAKEDGKKSKSKVVTNSFNSIQRQDYDMDKLERMLEATAAEPQKATPEVMKKAEALKKKLTAGV